MLRNRMDSGLVHTCIFVTHRPDAMKFCTLQYAVHDGTVRAENREAE